METHGGRDRGDKMVTGGLYGGLAGAGGVVGTEDMGADAETGRTSQQGRNAAGKIEKLYRHNKRPPGAIALCGLLLSPRLRLVSGIRERMPRRESCLIVLAANRGREYPS